MNHIGEFLGLIREQPLLQRRRLSMAMLMSLYQEPGQPPAISPDDIGQLLNLRIRDLVDYKIVADQPLVIDYLKLNDELTFEISEFAITRLTESWYRNAYGRQPVFFDAEPLFTYAQALNALALDKSISIPIELVRMAFESVET